MSHLPRLGGLLAGLLASLAAVPACAATPHELLAQAVQEYREALDSTDRDDRLQKFRRAEILFSQLIPGTDGEAAESLRRENADLYVNLGNAALGAERLGPAILAYRRALLLDPDHRRAAQNLLHARTLLPEWIPRPLEGGLFDTFFAWTGRLSRSERQNAAAVTFLATTVLLAIGIRWRRAAYRNVAVIPALAWAFFIGTLLFDARAGARDAAVVTAPETVARAADSAHAPARFSQPLPSGTEVDVLERRDMWLHIQLADRRDAWVPGSTVEAVAGGD